MARPKRILYENAVYHVTSRGNERQKIVRDDGDRLAFLKILEDAVSEHEVLVHAYVLMDNHFHLIVETPQKNLPAFMAHLNGVYTQRFNARHRRVGHLYQGRYKAIHVGKDVYLKELCRYVVLNPVRAKMTKQPGEWAWSSYRATAGLIKAPVWLETRWVLAQFGHTLPAARAAYRKYVLRGMEEAESPWDKATNGLYLGSEEFLAKMQGWAEKNARAEMPKYQKRLVRPSIDEVFGRVAKALGCRVEEIRRRGKKKNEPGDVAIYLLKRDHGYSLKQIGDALGIGFSAVGNRWHRMKARVAQDRKAEGLVEKCRM